MRELELYSVLAADAAIVGLLAELRALQAPVTETGRIVEDMLADDRARLTALTILLDRLADFAPLPDDLSPLCTPGGAGEVDPLTTVFVLLWPVLGFRNALALVTGHDPDSAGAVSGGSALPYGTVTPADLETAIRSADAWLRWSRTWDAALDKADQRIRQERELRAAAEQGDVAALLRLDGARAALRAGKGIRAWCGRTKATAAARRVLEAREQRRADARASERARTAAPGRIRALFLSRLRERAVAIGEAYHRHVKALYVSSRASVVYGTGGQAGEDSEAYSRAYRSRYGGARWLNAGARLDNPDLPICVILETSGGTEVARLPLDWEP